VTCSSEPACSFVPSFLPPPDSAPAPFGTSAPWLQPPCSGRPKPPKPSHLTVCARRQHHDGADASLAGSENHADRVTSQSQTPAPSCVSHVAAGRPPSARGWPATSCLILALHSCPCLHSRGSSAHPSNRCRPSSLCQWTKHVAAGLATGPNLTLTSPSTSVLGHHLTRLHGECTSRAAA
jgi:hypothetical protein